MLRSTAMDDRQLSELLLREIPGLLVAYRFGSTVTGATHAGSDVDLAVLAPHPLEGERRFEIAGKLEAELRRGVDLVDLRAAPTVLRMQVMTTGTVIVQDEKARTEFEDLTFSQYVRLNEERRAIVEQVLRERSVHGR